MPPDSLVRSQRAAGGNMYGTGLSPMCPVRFVTYVSRMDFGILERAKGFEPSTPTLARLCSTPELRPRSGL